MSSSPNKQKHPVRKIIFGVLILAILAVSAFLAYMAVHENHRQAQLEASINALQANLKAHGIEAQKIASCARNEEGFGEGAKHCDIGSEFTTNSRSEYFRAAGAYMNFLASSEHFTANSRLVELAQLQDNTEYHSVAYVQNSVKAKCGILYQFVKSRSRYDIQFSCDDTSWFVRTFEG